MGLIFRKNASRNEKAYTLFILTLLWGSVYVALSDFFPNSSFVWNVGTWSIIFFTAFLLFCPWLFDTNPVNRALSFGFFKKTLFFVTIYLFYVLISMGVVCHIFPFAYTAIAGEPFEDVMTVVEKSDSYVRRGCDLRMNLDRFDSWVCVSSDFYSSIAIDDEVILEGYKTRFGTHLTLVEKLGD